MVKFFVKTVATGFALSLGAAIYKKLSKQLGLDDNDEKTKVINQQVAVTDPPGASSPHTGHGARA